jgi:hypothetical protein
MGRVGKRMPDEHKRKPIANIINDMKNAAIQRCAERIEAARKDKKKL